MALNSILKLLKESSLTTTKDAAEAISQVLNAEKDFVAKVVMKVGGFKVEVSYEGKPCGYIDVGEKRPYKTLTKYGGMISRIADQVIRERDHSDLQSSPAPAAPRGYVPQPRDENEAQAREDGEWWTDQHGRRHPPGS